MTRSSVLIVWCALALSSTAARAYVRKTTSSGTPQAWGDACPSLVVRVGGPPPFGSDDLRALLEAAAAAWQDGPGTCATPPITTVLGEAGETLAQDYESSVAWRPADWCLDPEHGDDEVCLSPNVAAVTTTYFYERGARAGEIIETDIEINGAQPFAAAPGEAGFDLLAALVHELGHALGLDHTCATVPGGAPVVDDRGGVVPSCFPSAALSTAVTTATMYPYLRQRDPGARAPLADELGGVCAIYRGRDSRCVAPEAGCGCAGGGDAGAGAVLVVVALWGRRRASRGARRC